MSFLVERRGEYYEVKFESEPAYFHSLRMAPAEPEPMLNTGLWLILTFAIWSVPDRDAIASAMAVVRSLEGAVQLGVRPYDDPKEALTWMPEANVTGSPVWLVMKNGQLVEREIGTRSAEELQRAVLPHL